MSESLPLPPRQFLRLLLERCSSYESPLADCPLQVLRKEASIPRRLERLEALSDAEVEELCRRHLECVGKACGSC